MPTHELLRAALPTRMDKRRIARALGLSESILYKWCSTDSGVRTPLDCVDVIVSYAMAHGQPDAAMAIARHVETLVEEPMRRRAQTLNEEEVVLLLQPEYQRQLAASAQAWTHALRQLLLSGECDLDGLLEEVRTAGRAVREAELMIQSVIEARERGPAH